MHVTEFYFLPSVYQKSMKNIGSYEFSTHVHQYH